MCWVQENQIMSPSSGKSEVLNRKSGEWIIICVIQIFVIHIKYIQQTLYMKYYLNMIQQNSL